MRELFEQDLKAIQRDILIMGEMVTEELNMALRALETLDLDLAQQIKAADKRVNQTRFNLEDRCTTLIVTQQPAAGDLRSIVAVMNMIVDIERMGDQAKGIAKVIPHLVKNPSTPRPPELKQMGSLANHMLKQAMDAYATGDIALAQAVAKQDDEVDALYSRVFTQTMQQMANVGDPAKAEACYELLRAARELERFCDLTTNIAERVIYKEIGHLREINVDDN